MNGGIGNGNSSKRESEVEKIENPLNLSLALPDVSLSLVGSNRFDLQPSHNNAHSASLSCSYSHLFSHNLSCSLTRNSTDFSVRRGSDHFWNYGEGTNGSVHSRFRPIDINQVLHKETYTSDNISFFPSEMPARPRTDSESRKISRPERIHREIVSKSIPLMVHIVQELPDETVESTKEYLRSLIKRKNYHLLVLQNRLNRRCDLTNETLVKCHKTQLEFFVAIKMDLGSFLSRKKILPTTELVEVFLLERCRNINCMRALPVEDCEC